MPEFIIRTDKLGRDFKSVTAVDDLSLEVPSGIVFGFLGPNGAGKTTTIRLLLGLIGPTRGRAEVLGRDVRAGAGEIRALCGALLEHSGLYERLSAADNLDYYGRIWRLPDGERRDRVRELLIHFGLWERRNDTIGGWSRGMKQKLAVARTLLHRPRLIFLDEPTAGLDPVASASLRDDLAAMADKEGTTVFLTTHNLDEAERLCANAAIIRDGRLLATGPIDELKRRSTPAHIVDVHGRGFIPTVIERVRAMAGVERTEPADGILSVVWSGAPDTSALLRLLLDGGVEIEEVSTRKHSLEDAFLKLVKDEPTEDHSCSTI